MHAGLAGHGHGLAARQRNGEEMLLPVIAFVGFEVDDALGFIHSEQAC